MDLDPIEDHAWLFALDFSSGTCDGKTLTVHQNNITAFTDIPYRLVKPMDVSDFDDLWSSFELDNFTKSPPNAALYYNNKIVIIELFKCEKKNDSLTFVFNFINNGGEVINKSLDKGCLFIDAREMI